MLDDHKVEGFHSSVAHLGRLAGGKGFGHLFPKFEELGLREWFVVLGSVSYLVSQVVTVSERHASVHVVTRLTDSGLWHYHVLGIFEAIEQGSGLGQVSSMVGIKFDHHLLLSQLGVELPHLVAKDLWDGHFTDIGRNVVSQ